MTKRIKDTLQADPIGVPPRGWLAIAFYLGAGVAAELGSGLIIAYAIASCGAFLTYLTYRDLLG